jgi:hypothetical protein
MLKEGALILSITTWLFRTGFRRLRNKIILQRTDFDYGQKPSGLSETDRAILLFPPAEKAVGDGRGIRQLNDMCCVWFGDRRIPTQSGQLNLATCLPMRFYPA